MPPSQASGAYAQFVQRVCKAYKADMVKDGVFGAKMNVSLVNDGPVTYTLDSQDNKASK